MSNGWTLESYTLPVGSYLAVFEGVEDFQVRGGNRVKRFRWLVVDGDYKGQEISALAEERLTGVI